MFAALLSELGVDEAHAVYLADTGHMSGVDPLLGLDRAVRDGRVGDGDVVLLLSAGTGYTWAATVVRWGSPGGRGSSMTVGRYATTNGIRLHYLDHGGQGPVLVLAPGLTANAHSFDGLMHAGLAEVARVIALDLRGRGESDAPPSGYAMEDHARDVLGLLDALGLERVVMGGHSFGGLLTYWLAANHTTGSTAAW